MTGWPTGSCGRSSPRLLPPWPRSMINS
jgi:hypothetical protein